ncbi:MAG: tetratricopeptide repeat protein, partial [Lachnospiraceae bacterium]|nr:tetratricopeptide repeat protein [Lachnospiraceae bacterium]
MDKAEYRNKLEEINSCAETGAFREAALIADEIDWKHVRSTKTLCMIGEIYEANKRYEDSARILKYAYKRSSSSKTVLYRLAELDIRNGEYDEAKRLINEFEQNSPNDTSRYILRYKLMRALREPLDDQIAVLREYKEHEYTERWAYELAKLYRKNGQREKCIEECDDLILWFMEGRFVTKALELKKQLTELTPAQQAAYEAGLAGEKRQESRAAVTTGSRLTGLENVERAILASSDSDDDEEDVSTFGYVHAAAAALRQKGESGQEAPGVENIQAAQENNNQEN